MGEIAPLRRGLRQSRGALSREKITSSNIITFDDASLEAMK
jgi:hypothetical protein